MASRTLQSAMIDITVKTLDGQNRTFTVPENLNVRQFKEKISGSVEISADTQRLIFQGRVMQDDQSLKSYDVHGKVIHLVQRAPPTTSNSTTADTTSSPSVARPQIQLDGGLVDVHINLNRIQSTPNTNEARARIQQVEFNLRLIDNVLSQFEQCLVPPSGEPVDREGYEHQSSGQASRLDSSAAAANFSENRADTSTTNQPQTPGQETLDQQAGLTAVELASFLDQVLDTQNRVLVYIRQYQDLLRNEENYPPNSREAQNAQEVVNRVTEIFHALGHMMHNLSDVTVNISTSVPRQAVATPLVPVPFQIPGAPIIGSPIHVNVRSRQDNNRNRQRPHQQNSNATSTSGNTATSAGTAAQTAATADTGTTTTESTTTTSAFNAFQNITPTGVSAVMMEVFPTVVTQELNILSDPDDLSVAESRANTADESSTLPEVTSSAQSNTTSTAPSTTASPPPQRLGNSTYTSSTSTSTTITFEPSAHIGFGGGMNFPGDLPRIPGMPSGFFQNIFGSLLNTPGQVSVVQEVTTSEETSTRPGQHAGPHSREQRHSTTSSATGSTKKTSCKDTNTAKSTEKASSTNTSTSPSPVGNNTTTTTTNVSTSTTSSSSVPIQSANVGSRTHSNRGSRSRSTTLSHPYLINLGPTGQPRQQYASQGYVDPYLPCASTQYMSPTAQVVFSSLQGQARSQQQVPNLSSMVSGMVGEILGQASQQAVNAGVRASVSSTSTNTAPNTPPSAPTRVTTASSGSGHPPAAPNPSLVLGQTGSVPPEIWTMVGNLFEAMGTNAATSEGNAATAPSLADLFSHFRSGAEDRNDDPTGIISSLLETIASHIGMTDLLSLVIGNGQVLTHIREPLQEFVKGLVSQHGSVEQVVEVALNDLSSDVMSIQDLAEVKDGIDMVHSVKNCLRTHLLTIFNTLHSGKTDDVDNYGTHLYSLWKKLLAELLGLCVYCMSDGYPGFVNLLQSYLPRMTRGMSPAFTSWNTGSLQSILGTFYHSHPVPESDIICYVISRPDATTVPSSKPKTSSTKVLPNLMQTSSSGMSPSDFSGTTFPFKSNSPDSQPLKLPRTEIGSGAHEPLEDAQASHQTPIKHPNSLPKAVTHSLEGAGVITDVNDEWQSVVPQDWIPVISQDVERQQEQRPQPPFSDAYLQSLPAKRRRMMSLEHSHGLGNMLQYLPDSLKKAAETTGVTPCSNEEILEQEAADNLDLQAELEKELTTLLEARIISDKDFSLDRFPNAEQYFHKNKD